eukprot:2995928-Pleurochrysis_carterae.AAC.1
MRTTPRLVTGPKGARQQGQASEGPSAGLPESGEGRGGGWRGWKRSCGQGRRSMGRGGGWRAARVRGSQPPLRPESALLRAGAAQTSQAAPHQGPVGPPGERHAI